MLRKRWTSEQGHIDSPMYSEFETGQLDRLIEYLQVVDTSYRFQHPNYIMTLKSFINNTILDVIKTFLKHFQN